MPARFVARLERVHADLGREDALPALLAGLGAPRTPSVRVNTLCADTSSVRAELDDAGIATQTVDWYADALLLDLGPEQTPEQLQDRVRAVQETQAYERGALYLQGLASMTAPLALAPAPDEHVLDMAAAPGGKTTQLACLMQGIGPGGRLLANDSSRRRVYKLRAVLEAQGAQAVDTICRPGQGLGRAHPGAFDAVLLDAPCSAEARVAPGSPEAESWTPRRIPRLASLQRQLLSSAIAATRPGGRIVYATCTFAPEENEAVVEHALTRHAGDVEVAPLDLSLPPALPGLTQWGRKTFAPALAHTRRLLPGPGVEGFFLAMLRRTSGASGDASNSAPANSR